MGKYGTVKSTNCTKLPYYECAISLLDELKLTLEISKVNDLHLELLGKGPVGNPKVDKLHLTSAIATLKSQTNKHLANSGSDQLKPL